MSRDYENSEAPDDIRYGKARVFALRSGRWILPGQVITNDRDEAQRVAVAMHKILKKRN